MGRLDGKVALISGTARGMGRAAAVEFAAQGAAVFGCDLDEKASAETVDLVTAAGGRMAAIAPVDLSTAGGARAWVEAAAAEFGGVDILYNNASALRNGPLMELTDDDWHFTVRNELDIVWFSVRAAWPSWCSGAVARSSTSRRSPRSLARGSSARCRMAPPRAGSSR